MTSGRRSRRRRRRRSTRVARAGSFETRTASQRRRGSRRDAPSARTTSPSRRTRVAAARPHRLRASTLRPRRSLRPLPDFPDADAIRQHVARDVNALADARAPPPSRLRALRRVADVIDAAPLPPRRDRRGRLRQTPPPSFRGPLRQCRETATDAFASLARRSDAVLELLLRRPVLRDLDPPTRTRGPSQPSEEIRARTRAAARSWTRPRRAWRRTPPTPSGSSCTRWRTRTPTSRRVGACLGAGDAPRSSSGARE